MENASGRTHPEDKPTGPHLTDNSLRLSVLEGFVKLGHPIILTVVLKRKIATRQTVKLSCFLNLQTYTGKRKTGLGVIKKTLEMRNQGTRVEAVRPWAPPTPVIPPVWTISTC